MESSDTKQMNVTVRFDRFETELTSGLLSKDGVWAPSAIGDQRPCAIETVCGQCLA